MNNYHKIPLDERMSIALSGQSHIYQFPFLQQTIEVPLHHVIMPTKLCRKTTDMDQHMNCLTKMFEFEARKQNIIPKQTRSITYGALGLNVSCSRVTYNLQFNLSFPLILGNPTESDQTFAFAFTEQVTLNAILGLPESQEATAHRVINQLKATGREHMIPSLLIE